MTSATRTAHLETFGRQALDIFDRSDIPEVAHLADALRADAAHRGPIVWRELAAEVLAKAKAARP